MERFWAKVDLNGDGGCWLWTAYIDDKGYGQFRDGHRQVKAYRFAYESLVGPVPEGLELDHLCRVRTCVNPSHLEPVTHRENMLRGVRATQTHCINGHEFTEDNIYPEAGRRKCLRCRRNRSSGRPVHV